MRTNAVDYLRGRLAVAIDAEQRIAHRNMKRGCSEHEASRERHLAEYRGVRTGRQPNRIKANGDQRYQT